ncbi:duplicated orphan permease [Alteromonadaceae bacterium Bs31]|nr:duplicated orphan permease [Alteromonadaceae bacterium Bs31]
MILGIRDFTYALRLLSKSPGFTLLTVAVMAAGIGLCLYMYSILNIFFYEPLAFDDGEDIVRLWQAPNGTTNFGKMHPLDYEEVKEQVNGFSEIVAFDNRSLSVVGRDGAVRYKGTAVEPNFFQFTRTKPILGRDFTPRDAYEGAEPVMVLSYEMWQSKFHGDESALDETLRLDGVPHRIIGVMPEGYHFPQSAEFWMPLKKDPTRTSRKEPGRRYHGAARLGDGISIDEANRQLALTMSRIEQQHPETNSNIGMVAANYKGVPSPAMIYPMQFSAALILILASLNVGNLLFSRAIERSKETAIRAALGAPRWVLVRQMLMESAIICFLGGLIGLFFVGWGLEVAGELFRSRFIADRPPFWWDFSIDFSIIKWCIIFVLFTILVTGGLPAWRNSGDDFNSVLRDGTRGALGKRAGRLSGLLVISEIFVSITVLLAASMLIITSYKLSNAEIGADIENKFIGKVSLPAKLYDTPEKKAQYAMLAQSRLENSTGIGNVMVAFSLPGDGGQAQAYAIDGLEYSQDQGYPRVNYIVQSIGSLPKFGIDLIEGRYFNNADRGLDKQTIIVTDSFAKQNFENESAIGKRIRIVSNDNGENEWLTIVGVVSHVAYGNPFGERSKVGAIFRPYAQSPTADLHFILEMKAARSIVVNTFRDKLASIDPGLPAFRFETFAQRRDRFAGGLTFISRTFLIVGIVAVLLAASGIYGVTSNTIQQRTREIGVKRALGALDWRITTEFLRKGFYQFLWGAIPGLAIGCAIGFAMSKQQGIPVTELILIPFPLVLAIAGVVLVSTYLPTQRALEIMPSDALRYE